MLNTTWNCVISFEVNDAAAFVYREPEPRGGYSIIPRKEAMLGVEVVGNVHENSELLEVKK